jgi:hypothetical protein
MYCSMSIFSYFYFSNNILFDSPLTMSSIVKTVGNRVVLNRGYNSSMRFNDISFRSMFKRPNSKLTFPDKSKLINFRQRQRLLLFHVEMMMHDSHVPVHPSTASRQVTMSTMGNWGWEFDVRHTSQEVSDLL